MNKILIALAITVLAAGPVAASDDKTAAMLTVHQFIDSLNKGDVKATVATCADQTSIIDEVPPHEWHGAAACSKWIGEITADAEKNGITDALVTLGTPRHVDVTADHAYVVVPADYSFKQKGKPGKETNSTFTLVLQKAAAGWRITGFAWAKN